jgi:hypothetical protein
MRKRTRWLHAGPNTTGCARVVLIQSGRRYGVGDPALLLTPYADVVKSLRVVAKTELANLDSACYSLPG